MVAVIKGDVINSRKVEDPSIWLNPLKAFFKKLGKTPAVWEITGGDGFQIKLKDSALALQTAIEIKTILKAISIPNQKPSSGMNARMAIGIGVESYTADRISESNGTAYIYAGDRFESLRKDKLTLALQTDFPDFDHAINLLLKLAAIYMDNWTPSSAALMQLALRQPDATQEELGKKLSISQSSVSGRWNRAHVSETLEIIAYFQSHFKHLAV